MLLRRECEVVWDKDGVGGARESDRKRLAGPDCDWVNDGEIACPASPVAWCQRALTLRRSTVIFVWLRLGCLHLRCGIF